MQVSTYQQAIDYLYNQYPLFQNVGSSAYKPGMGNIQLLCDLFGNPQQKIKCIHIAGTNGKGSSSNMLAAVLQASGYKTGLYTSPHLKRFTERIRINGEELEENYLFDFLNENFSKFEKISPSFFEITTLLAFKYFADKNVDVVVLETGLGGRLDSTNLVTPLASLITNIGWDHVDLLGDTLPKIALEKAGIIKENIPVVISEYQDEDAEVFINKAKTENAALYFADKEYFITNSTYKNGFHHIQVQDFELNKLNIDLQLAGNYQLKNIKGVLKVISILKTLGFSISDNQIIEGLRNISSLTNFKGRWFTIKHIPLTICDTGHNVNGIASVFDQIASIPHQQLWCIIGFAKDKDIQNVLSLLPKNAKYVFCEASIQRAAKAETLLDEAQNFGLQAIVIKNVNEALAYVWKLAEENDFVFVGGSTFVVGEIDSI